MLGDTDDSSYGGETYEAEAFERLAAIEARSFWFRSRNALIMWLIQRWCGEAENFLEVGCGTGFVLSGIRSAHPGIELVGVEPYDEGVAVARRRLPEVSIHGVEAQSMAFEQEFDAAGSFDVLEHIPDDGAALAGIRRALKPGGTLLIAVPQHAWLWSAADDYAHHQRRYSRSDLIKKVEVAGFEVLDAGSFMSLTLPFMVASRLAYRVRPARRSDPLGDLELPGPLNAGLVALLGAERALIRLGVRFPAGGSLYLVARRPERG